MESLKEVTGQIVSVVWHYCQRFSLCWGKVFQWLPKDWHKKVSDFCKMKFVHVHFAADWMNKFPNRGKHDNLLGSEKIYILVQKCHFFNIFPKKTPENRPLLAHQKGHNFWTAQPILIIFGPKFPILYVLSF
jgi:hypothetical protein